MKRIWFNLLGLFIVANIAAQDSLQVDSIGRAQAQPKVELSKAEGDSAYINNDYASAIQIYEGLLEKGESAEIYYNLGNSYYKSDNIARAILNYERALLLSPGNGDIRTNLEIARSKTVDKINEIPDVFFVTWMKSLIDSTSVDVWAKWGIAFFLLFIAGLYFYFFSKQIVRKKIGFIGALVMLAFTVCANVFANYQKKTLLNRDTAIVMSPSVTVRSTPNESGTSLFILHEGTKVKIKDNSMKGWKEIMLQDGKVGWISLSDIEII